MLQKSEIVSGRFSRERMNRLRSSMDVASNSLARSPVSSSSCDEVPHIITRKSRLRSGKFLINGAKRLLQHNLPIADLCTAAKPHLFDHLVGAQQDGRRQFIPIALRS